MTRYEYQVLEADAPTVPAEMLNQQGEEGWRLCGVLTRDTRPNEKGGGDKRWIFYFTRELPNLAVAETSEETNLSLSEHSGARLRGAGAVAAEEEE